VAATYLVKPSSLTAIYVREDDQSGAAAGGSRAADQASTRHAGPEGGAQ
jgi:hypothetical protein